MKNVGKAKTEILSKLLKIDGFCIQPFLEISIFFPSFEIIDLSGQFKDELSFISFRAFPFLYYYDHLKPRI